jgi:8-amino-7-oxononanoate synthase
LSEAALVEGLAEAGRRHLERRRRLVESPQGAVLECDGARVVNFSSNDYLGLANHPRITQAAAASLARHGLGAGASPLVCGHMRAHAQAEERFAAFTGAPRALLFGSGYAANLGILAALGGTHAEIFSDALNHACLIDGSRLSRAAVTVYPHADSDALERCLEASRAGVKIVATDAVFSMDGDIAPLPRILALCERYDAWLVVDDAHGIGVLGARGRGSLDHFGLRSARIVHMATLGKALGGYGAFVAASPTVVEWLVQRARTYVYSTALPPMLASAAQAAIELLEEDGSLVDALHARMAQLGAGTAIHPIILGGAEQALEASQRLLRRGFLVPAIRPPTVPDGTSRLRVSLSAAHSQEQVEALRIALRDCVPG